MGACDFTHVAKGKSAKEAFDSAVRDAQYDYGHAGYTGTIAEKDSFVMITPPDGVDPAEYAHKLIGYSAAPQNDLKFERDQDAVNDKWGPAGCIALGGDEYLFFGWASS